VSRRRIYLMRHAHVSYFDERGRPVRPDDVSLTPEGRDQARAAGQALAGIEFDRVITSGLARTVETVELVAPGREHEEWDELRELEGGRLGELPEDELEQAFVGFFKDVVHEDTRFLGGETIGALLDRVIPALERVLIERDWDVMLAVLHGGVNRAILSHALTRGRLYLGNFEQAPACINVLDVGEDWVVRAVNVTPYDLVHARGRATTMEELWQQFRSI
jgi:probable phosphoglycerate mutase